MNEPVDGGNSQQPAASGPSGGKSGDFTMTLFWVLAIAFVFSIWMRGSLSPSNRGGLASGEPAPPIKAAGWLNGEPPAADTFPGKVVIVEAWATWCMPCRMKVPELIKLYDRYHDRGILFYGLTSEPEDALPEIKEFIADTGVKWTVGYGATDTLNALQAEYIPSLWVIGPDGTIVWNQDTDRSLEETLDLALKQAQ